MRTKISLMLPLICSPLVFWGCGDDVTEVNENSYMAVLESGKKLSKQPCDSTRVGDLLFVVDSSATFVCDGKGWASLKGAKGDVGATGAQGEKGDKGATGAAGTGCTASALESTKDHANGGVKITCGDKSYELWSGNDGEPGKNGESAYELSGTELSLEKWLKSLKGDKGETGESCTLADDGNGSVKIICGEKTATIYKALCGETPYDPAKKFCYEQELYDCDGEPYDPSKQFCHEQKLYDICDGKSYDPSKLFCYEQKLYDFCGGKAYEPVKQICQEQKLYDICDGKPYDPSKQFCHEQELYACGDKPYDPSKQFCHEQKLYACGDKPYDPSKQYCLKLSDDNGKKYQLEDLLTDTRDGQIYRTVTVGTQTWMAENLNYNPGDVSSMGSYAWSGCNNDDEDNCEKYGRLYTWEVAMAEPSCAYGSTCSRTGQVQDICPEGWHLPSKAEWEALFTAVGGFSTAGKALKSTSGWNSSVNDTDAYGLSALPAGSRNYDGDFVKAGSFAYFWSSTEINSGDAYLMTLYYLGEEALLVNSRKDYGGSVRCIQNKSKSSVAKSS